MPGTGEGSTGATSELCSHSASTSSTESYVDVTKAPTQPIAESHSLQIVLLALSPVIAVVAIALLTVWWIIGKLCSLYTYVHCALSTIAVIGLYLVACRDTYSTYSDFKELEISDYQFSESLILIPSFHCAAAVTVLMLRFLVADPNADQSHWCDEAPAEPWGTQPWKAGGVAASVNFIYTVVQGCLYSGEMSRHWVVALLVTSAALSICQVVALSRIWRPTSRASLLLAEARLLDTAIVTVEGWTRANVVGTHYIDVPCADPNEDAAPVVLVHGWGGGAALWFNNLSEISRHRRVLAVDLRGCGASDRDRFPHLADAAEAEAFFVEGLERWRVEMKLDKFVLVGHSLGAIIATAYTLSHPTHVEHLVLASPATPREFREDHPFNQNTCALPLIRFLWSYTNTTPQDVLRFLGPIGPYLVQSMLERRIRNAKGTMEHEEMGDQDAFAAYFYHNWCRKGSGEYSLNTVLQPPNQKTKAGFGSARLPLIDRMKPGSMQCACSFIYGDRKMDWMDYKQGQLIVDQLKTGGVAADLHHVSRAGHQVFLEQPTSFNATLIRAIKAHTNSVEHTCNV